MASSQRLHIAPSADVCVLVNAHARRVTQKFVKAAEALVGTRHVFYSQTLDDAARFASTILERGYATVVCGGGDGTLLTTYNCLQRAANGRPMPRLAFLNLGTGNGLQRVAGAKRPVDDLRTIAQGRAPNHHNLSLIDWQGQYFTFGGLGYDSLLLNDYNSLRRRTNNPLMRPVFQSVLGYFTAVFARTLPKALMQAPLHAQIISRQPSFRIDSRRGDLALELPAGSELYNGPISMVGFGTTPFFGYGLRMFPFAGMRPGMMQLRIASIPPLQALGALPRIWRGSYRNPNGIFDFLVRDLEVQLSRPYPFQISGDDQGLVQKIELKVAPHLLQLVDLYDV
jgi:diacylglycerol kinase family enzyme